MAKILYLEDAGLLRNDMKELLESISERPVVDAFKTPALALQTDISKAGYDLAILDYNMPGMTGVEFAAKLREDGLTIPIIIYTARAESELRDKHPDYDRHNLLYVKKGSEPRTLIERVKSQLHRREVGSSEMGAAQG